MRLRARRRPSVARSTRRTFRMSIDAEPGDLRSVLEARLVGRHRLVEVVGRGGDEVLVGPALLGDVSEPGVEQREVGSGIDRQMHHVVLAGFDFAGVDRHGSAGIDENDPRRRMRFAGNLRLLLVDRSAAQIRHPVVQEIVGLRFQGVRARPRRSYPRVRRPRSSC